MEPPQAPGEKDSDSDSNFSESDSDDDDEEEKKEGKAIVIDEATKAAEKKRQEDITRDDLKVPMGLALRPSLTDRSKVRVIP